jgi:hypothetical protein
MSKQASKTAPAAPAVARVTVTVAKAQNFAQSANPSALARASLVKPGKGENLKRVRVYGYDNGAGAGRVNKAASIAIVPGTSGSPKGVTPAQWAALVTFGGKPVDSAYAGGVTARTVRRSYRAGFIRFVA